MRFIPSTFVLFAKALISVSGKYIIEMSGYMAYAILLAFFPFLMFLVACSTYIVSSENIHMLLDEMNKVVPPEVSNTLNPVVIQVLETTDTSLLTFSILSALILSSSGVEALRSGLNEIFGLKEERGFFIRRFQATLFVLIGAAAFLIASLCIILLPILLDSFHYVMPDLPILNGIFVSFARYLMTFLILAWVGALFYKVLPNQNQTYKECLPGSYLAAGLWVGMASLFSIYLDRFSNYSIIYGSLTGVIITLLFFQLTAMMLLFGAQYNLERQKNRTPKIF